MYIEYVYQKNQIVFARATGQKPYPARVTKVDAKKGIYAVSFIGYKSTAHLLASMMQKFNHETIAFYENQYRQSTDKEDKTILRKINLAKKIYQKQFASNCRKIGMDRDDWRNEDANQQEHAITKEQEAINTRKDVEKHSFIKQQQKSRNLFGISGQKGPSEGKGKKMARKIVKLMDTLDQLSPIHSQTDTYSYPYPESQSPLGEQPNTKVQEYIQEEVIQLSSDSIIPSSAVSSAPSMHFTIPQYCENKLPVIKEECQPSTAGANPPNLPKIDYLAKYGSDQDSESEIQGKVLNQCSDANMYDIDCLIDEKNLEEGDYLRMLSTMNYRKKKLSIETHQQIICHLVKIIDLLQWELEREKKGRRPRALPMKQKQYLIVILSLAEIGLGDFLKCDCIFKMIHFIFEYEASPSFAKRLFFIEDFSIRSKINILRLNFYFNEEIRDQVAEKAAELINAFRGYEGHKYIMH